MITKKELENKRMQIENAKVIEEIGDRLLDVSDRVARDQLKRSKVVNKKEKRDELSETGSNLLAINHKISIAEKILNVR